MNFYDDDEDPYNDRHTEPPAPCSHGNGDNCDCQFGWYSGLYIVPIEFSNDGKVRHLVVRMKQTHDGGMRDFLDPMTYESVASCGLFYGREHVQAIEDFHA